MSEDRKDVFIDPTAVAAADERIRQANAMTAGLMSSWANPLDGVSPTGPKGPVARPIANVKASPAPAVPPIPARGFAIIPQQAMDVFKEFLSGCFEIEVALSQEQAVIFLEMIETMPTPQRMFEAKAIFMLMESLTKIVGKK